MKKFVIFIALIFMTVALYAQKVVRVGPYQIIYRGEIIDTLLVEEPKEFFNWDTDVVIEQIRERDTIIREFEVARYEPMIPMYNAWNIKMDLGLPFIINKRIDNTWNTNTGFAFSLGGSYRVGLGSSGITFDGGLSLDVMTKKMSFETFSEQLTGLRDKDGHYYNRIATYNDVEEKSTSCFISIPLLFEFSNVAYNRVVPYGVIGIKPGIAIGNSFRVEGTYTTTGYYPEWDVVLHDIPELGLFTDREISDMSENQIKATALLSGRVAFGVMIPLSRYVDYSYNRNLIRVGAFCEYGKVFTKKADLDFEGAKYYPGQNNILSGSKVSMVQFGLELGFIIGKKIK